MTAKASDLAARMAATATGSRPRPAQTDSLSSPPARNGGRIRRPVELPARFTVELQRSQHRYLKRFAMDADSDASSVIRALLTLLEGDPGLRERVQERVEP